MPIRRMKEQQIPPRKAFHKTPVMTTSAEWKQLQELLEQGQLRAGEALEVDFCKESRTLCKNPVISFRLAFLKRLPPKRYRYEMFARGGKLYLVSALKGKGGGR